MRKRIALVNQRYGLEVNGGSELYTRQIAERLAGRYDVDVITTKALDYTTWEDHYDKDEETINGVRVLRFSVDETRAKDFSKFNAEYLEELKSGNLSAEREELWFRKQGPYCPRAIEYIIAHKDDYSVMIFVTYLYYLTVKGLPEAADKAIFIPTAHDEPYIRFGTYEKLFAMPKAFIYLTDEEKGMIERLFGNGDIPSVTAGAGVELPADVSVDRFGEKYGIDGDYLIYVGRIDEGKNCPEMFRYFTEYKKRRGGNLRLVLMGKAACSVPKADDIVSLGFVSDEDKFDGIAGAKALLLPSAFESLSISVLEAMALNVPVLVNGKSDVLRGHCVKSNAGLYYNDYFEFEGALEYMLGHKDEYSQMRVNGRKYVDENYQWNVIMDKIAGVIEVCGQA